MKRFTITFAFVLLFVRMPLVVAQTTPENGGTGSANTTGYTRAGLGAAGTAGRIRRLTDSVSGFCADTGTQWVCTNDQDGLALEWFGAKGDDSTNDYTAINNCLTAASNAGGGDCVGRPGAVYQFATGLVIPKRTRLVCPGVPSHTNVSCVFKPTNAVSVGLRGGDGAAAADGTGIGLEGITLDMQLMPNGAVGIRWSGVWLSNMRRIAITGFPDATSIGIHIRGSSSTTTGSLYNSLEDINISQPSGTKRGIGIKLEQVSTEAVNAITIMNARVSNLTTGYILSGTGSGAVFINCNSEGHTGDGVQVLDTTSGTEVSWIGGEVASNGGWGFTGNSNGNVSIVNTAMSSNTSGDIDTATLRVGARQRTTSTGPTLQVDGAHLRSDRSFIGGKQGQTVTASDTISAKNLLNRLTAAAPLAMTSDPQVEIGTDIQLLTLRGTNDANSVLIVDGQGLRLRGNALLGSGDVLAMFFDSGGTNDWVEYARAPRGSKITTSSSTATTLLTRGLPDAAVYYVRALVQGVKSSGTDRASYVIEGTVYRTGGGAATLQGAATATYTQESNAAWNATIDTSGNNVRVRVTGVAATTIKWGGSLEISPVREAD
jgi:hypothetical protein